MALTAEQAYIACKEDLELATSRAAFAAWGTGRDCSQAEYEKVLRDEFTALWQSRIDRGELQPHQAGKAA